MNKLDLSMAKVKKYLGKERIERDWKLTDLEISFKSDLHQF